MSFNTAAISLFWLPEEITEGEQVTINATKDPEGVYLSVKADKNAPSAGIVGFTLTSDEAQALIADLQAALNAHWGNA